MYILFVNLEDIYYNLYLKNNETQELILLFSLNKENYIAQLCDYIVEHNITTLYLTGTDDYTQRKILATLPEYCVAIYDYKIKIEVIK